MANIKLKNKAGVWTTYNGVNEIKVPLADGTGYKSFGANALPADALQVKDNCSYKFAYSNGTWMLRDYLDSISWGNIYNAESMFLACESDANLSSKTLSLVFDEEQWGMYPNIRQIFSNCSLSGIPALSGKVSFNFQEMFNSCMSITETDIARIFANLTTDYQDEEQMGGDQTIASMFAWCNNIRNFNYINNWIQTQIGTKAPNFQVSYMGMYQGCTCADNVLGIPVFHHSPSWNQLDNAFYRLARANGVTFATNNGTPYTVNWQNQTMDLGRNMQWGGDASPTGCGYWNWDNTNWLATGITLNDNIFNSANMSQDDMTARYNQLKNTTNWYSSSQQEITYDSKTVKAALLFSRYNHDSAVATINSLPDCSSSGGTNTLKLQKYSGALTDAGGVETLTADEILVATNKGWTVTFVE